MTKRARAASFISCDPASIHTTIAVGDSITLGGPGLVGGYRAPLFRANPGLKLVGRLFSYGYHEGHSGLRIDEISALVLPIIPSFAPSVILLLAGTNNLNQGQTSAVAFPLLQQFAIDLKAFPSVSHVLVATIPYLNSQPVQQGLFNASILSWAPPAGITVHDICGTLVYPADFADALHPSTAGYQQKMEPAWSTAVQAVVF